MTQLELHQILLRYAKSDLAKARRQMSGIYISQTKVGLVDLTYNAEAKTYTAYNMDGTFNVTGKAKEIEAAIASIYDVIVK